MRAHQADRLVVRIQRLGFTQVRGGLVLIPKPEATIRQDGGAATSPML